MSLSIIQAEKLIYTAWQQMFGHQGLLQDRQDLGLQFDIRILIKNRGYEKDGNTYHGEWEREFYRHLTIVVTGRHQVFIRSRTVLIGADGQEQQSLVADWKNTSNHDSGWHSDGLREIWDSMSAGWSHCWDHVPREHQRPMAGMYHYCSINDSELIKLVRVEVDRDPSCPISYLRILKSVTPAKFQIQVE